jgi:TonB family protein
VKSAVIILAPVLATQIALAATPALADQPPAKSPSAGATSASSYDPTLLQAYYKDMWNRIQKKWWVPEELLFKQVQLNMTLEKDGKLSSISIAQSSGDKSADTLAVIGVKRASPFAPLPDGVQLPFKTRYTIGFKPRTKSDVMLFNGKMYEKGESITFATGTKLTDRDYKTSDLDKEFHIKKEAALIKLDKLDDDLAAAQKANAPPASQAKLLMDCAACLVTIQEQKEALVKLSEAYELLDKNKTADLELYPCLSRLAQLKYTTGDLTGAEPLFKRALEIQEKPEVTARDTEYKSLLEMYAKLLYKQNRAPEADEIYKKIKALG